MCCSSPLPLQGCSHKRITANRIGLDLLMPGDGPRAFVRECYRDIADIAALALRDHTQSPLVRTPVVFGDESAHLLPLGRSKPAIGLDIVQVLQTMIAYRIEDVICCVRV